jgi:hypothetical protein
MISRLGLKLHSGSRLNYRPPRQRSIMVGRGLIHNRATLAAKFSAGRWVISRADYNDPDLTSLVTGYKAAFKAICLKQSPIVGNSLRFK